MSPLQLSEYGVYARGRELELRGALAVGAQLSRNVDRDVLR
jgi:hypothetical protein